jgi:hypothetical protein
MKKQSNYLMYALLSSAMMLSVREGEGDGGGGSAPQITPEMQALIDAQVAQQVSGLKAKRDELLAANHQIKDQLKAFEGVDVNKYREYQQRLDADEDAKLLAEGKKELVVEKYTTRMRQDFEAKLAEKEQAIEQERQRGKRYEQAVLDNHIRQACVGMHPSAIEDALLHGRQHFTLDAEGRPVKLDAEGRPELGKDGKNPFSPGEWIESLKETKPHWFPASSSGSGSGGASGAGAGAGKTISREKFEAMGPAQRAEVARAGVKIV